MGQLFDLLTLHSVDNFYLVQGQAENDIKLTLANWWQLEQEYQLIFLLSYVS